MKKWINWLIVTIVGVFIAVLAFLFNLWILPMLVHYQVGKTMALNPNTDIWELFTVTPIPIYFSVYLFNLVNPEEVLRGEKPKVEQIGPYVYKETKVKKDVKLSDVDDTVEYHQYSWYHFDAKASYPRTEDDEITPVNIFLHVVADLLGELKYLDIIDEILDLAFPDLFGEMYTPALKTTPRELLFSGIELKCNNKTAPLATKIICSGVKNFPGLDTILSVTPDGNVKGSILGFNYLKINKNMYDLKRWFYSQFLAWSDPDFEHLQILNVRLRRFYKKNGTHNGLFKVKRGVNNINELGKIVEWNGKTTVSNWGGPECNKISGNDETLLPPFVTPSTQIQIFNTDICSSAKIIYSGNTVFQGINGYRFVVYPKFMGDVKEYPENYCYCPQSIEGITNPGPCLHKGVLDISSCTNLPTIVSYPHFYQASEVYKNVIDGLKPDKKLHESYIDIEPTTGVPLRGYKRVQVNIRTKRTTALRILTNQTEAIFPLMWFEEKAELGDKEVSMLRDQLLKVLNIADIIKWFFIGFGLFLALLGITMTIIRSKEVRKHKE